MSALLASRAPALDPVAQLLHALGAGAVDVATLGDVWSMDREAALDVASDAEAAGLVQTSEDSDGRLVVALTPVGRRRAGLASETATATTPAGHKRIPYVDAAGVRRWLVVPSEVARALDTHDRETRRSDARWRDLVATGDGGSGEDFARLATTLADPHAIDPAEAIDDAPGPTPANGKGERPAARSARGVRAPLPILLLGLRPVWSGPAEPVATPCRGCGGRPLGMLAACLMCDRSGNEGLLERVHPSERPKPPASASRRSSRPPPGKSPSRAPALDREPKSRKPRRGFRLPSPARNSFDLSKFKNG